MMAMGLRFLWDVSGRNAGEGEREQRFGLVNVLNHIIGRPVQLHGCSHRSEIAVNLRIA